VAFTREAAGLTILRLMRAFRVLRLFGRLSDLRQVINLNPKP